MGQGVIDDNSRAVAKGVYFDKKALHALPLTFNPITGALIIEIIPHAIGTLNVPSRMPVDDNSWNVDGGLTNDLNKTLLPLSVDLIAGFPLLRIEHL